MPHTSGSNTSNCHSHTRGHQPHPTGTTKLVATNHIQLPPPNTWVPITSNNHCRTRRHQTHLTVITIYVGANQIQLLPPHAWATNHTQLPQPQLRAQTTSNWHHQTRGYQSHPIAVATHLGIKYIQLPQPHTRAPTTSNWHHEIREYQSHPIAMPAHLGNQSNRTATTTYAGTNHIQLAQPTSWVPISFNCHATHFGMKHIQLPQLHTRAPTTSNWHHQTRGHQSYPIATAKYMGTNHFQ